MYGKIVKHELLANIKLYGIMLGIGLLIVIGLFIGATPLNSTHFYINAAGVSAVILFVFSMVTLMVIILLHFIWQGIRYAQSMYGREGYLSFTLPVSPVELILGKFTASVILGIGVAVLCGLLIFSNVYSMMGASYMEFGTASAGEVWGMFYQDIKRLFSDPPLLRCAISFVIAILLRMLLLTNYIFLAITLANLPCFRKGNTILTFVFLYFIPYIEEIIIGVFTTAFIFINGGHFLRFWERLNMAMEIGDFSTIWNSNFYIIWRWNVLQLLLVAIHMILVIWLAKKYTTVTA